MNIQRLFILLSLMGQKTPIQQACLSDEQLIALINGELKGKALRQVQQHLQACPDCYQEWQQTCDMMQIAPEMTLPNKISWLERARLFLTPKPLLISAFTSIFAIILFLPLAQHSLQQQINDAYQQFEQVAANSELMTMDVPTNQGFSFVNNAPSARQLAFQQGVNIGRGLSQSIEVQDSDYYELGRWIALLEQASQLDFPDTFWQQQLQILQQFQQALVQDQSTSAHLDKLSDILVQLPATDTFSLYDKLYRYTDFMIQDLGVS